MRYLVERADNGEAVIDKIARIAFLGVSIDDCDDKKMRL